MDSERMILPFDPLTRLPPPPPSTPVDFDFAEPEPSAAMESAEFTITRRSTRSFVESELDANMRELNALASDTPAAAASSSSRASTVSSSASSYISPTAALLDGADMAKAIAGLQLDGHGNVHEAAAAAAAEAADEDLNRIPGLPDAPVNFGLVTPGIFRSSYPKPENYNFIAGLQLRSIITLVDKNYTGEYAGFIAERGIRHYMFAMKGTKKEDIPLATMQSILSLVLDRRNYPLLIHCNQGRHRTGCVVGIMRAICGWDRDLVTQEYRRYAGSKVRDCDVDYLRAFEMSGLEKLLARDDLQIDEFIVDGRLDESFTRPLPTTVGFRVPNFFRTTFFSMAVLLIWMVSGSKMPATTESGPSRA